jgi:L-aspartate oxidase
LVDITHKDEATLRERFPSIFDECLKRGINMARDYIPSSRPRLPCGGVVTISTRRRACPASTRAARWPAPACMGPRLASNSLLEAVVLAHRGARAVVDFLRARNGNRHDLPEWVAGKRRTLTSASCSCQLGRTAPHDGDSVGIVRSTKRLERARARVQMLIREIHEYYWQVKVEPRLLELRNMVRVADLIVTSALQRQESRGLHYTLDFPDKYWDPHDTTLRRGGFY